MIKGIKDYIENIDNAVNIGKHFYLRDEYSIFVPCGYNLSIIGESLFRLYGDMCDVYDLHKFIGKKEHISENPYICGRDGTASIDFIMYISLNDKFSLTGWNGGDRDTEKIHRLLFNDLTEVTIDDWVRLALK